MDSWDKLRTREGVWADPFSSPDYTKRQRRYQQARGLKNIYTPMLVANNTPARGNRVAEIVKEESAKRPALAIDVGMEIKKGRVVVKISVRKIAKLEVAERVGVTVVLYQRDATTKCPKGENAGKTLVEHFNVIAALDPVPLKRVLEKGNNASFKIPKGVETTNLGVAVLVEDPEKMLTLECIAVPVAEPN